MKNENFFATLAQCYKRDFERPFLTLPEGRSFTYGEIDALACQFAGALIMAGARTGDRIVVQVEKSPQNIALYLGAMRAGLVYVPLNTAYTNEEISYFIADAAPAVIICQPDREAATRAIARAENGQTVLTLGANGQGSLADHAAQTAPLDTVVQRQSDDLAVILYTSGTTGRSKGAKLTHENLRSNAIALNKLWGFSPADVLVHALPIFHIHGLFVALHTAILSACEILFLPKFDVGELRRQLPRASVMMGVPTFYSRLLAEKDFSEGECRQMRLFISGSAPLTQETFAAFEARTGHRILERYGMSEAGMIASNPLDGERVAGTVGLALPGVSIRINNGDRPDAPGEVEVKGPNIFSGYWNMTDKTREAFTTDGYFKTGDIGVLDDEGRLTLSGRDKDMIIAGGFNIYPIEVEQILDAVPGVAESAVIAAPHPDMGEGVVAVLVAQDQRIDKNALNATLSSLAKFKRPRKFFWVEALPRNAMGKVQKQALRERYQSAFS